MTTTPGLSRAGVTRVTVEAVRIAREARGQGLGTALLEAVIQDARARGADLLQLTSDLTRTEAHAFYERLGFERSHAGFKLAL